MYTVTYGLRNEKDVIRKRCNDEELINLIKNDNIDLLMIICNAYKCLLVREINAEIKSHECNILESIIY